MPFKFQRQDIVDIVLIKPQRFADARGFFMETYKHSDFVANGIVDHFVQENFSRSARGVLRGLHFQKAPRAQGKLVTVLRGEVFDVAVDIRLGSPTFGCWVGTKLSEASGNLLYVPAGFAHGFCVLSEEADFSYRVTAEYSPEQDAGIRWNDATLGIDWPVCDPHLSDKDAALPLLDRADTGFVYTLTDHRYD